MKFSPEVQKANLSLYLSNYSYPENHALRVLRKFKNFLRLWEENFPQRKWLNSRHLGSLEHRYFFSLLPSLLPFRLCAFLNQQLMVTSLCLLFMPRDGSASWSPSPTVKAFGEFLVCSQKCCNELFDKRTTKNCHFSPMYRWMTACNIFNSFTFQLWLSF